MDLVTKSSITSVLNTKRNNTINTGIVWTRNNPPNTSIANWFENTNTTNASLNANNPISASEVISSISSFVTNFANYRKVRYVQQYTRVYITSKGAPTGATAIITESDVTNKGIISSTGASKGGVSYKPNIAADRATLVSKKDLNYDTMVKTINDTITRWTNNYNSTVTLTYNRGNVNWDNHSQRGRR